MNEGHWQASDWWSVGVLIFELCSGLPPFYMEDKLAMYRRIVSMRYDMPSNFSPALKDLIGCLLVRNPALRLGGWKGA